MVFGNFKEQLAIFQDRNWSRKLFEAKIRPRNLFSENIVTRVRQMKPVHGRKKDNMDVSEKRGTPKSSILNRVFHCKPSILGYPYFWKHPHGVEYNQNIPKQTSQRHHHLRLALKSVSILRASSSSMSHQALRAVKHCENVPSARGILFPKCFK